MRKVFSIIYIVSIICLSSIFIAAQDSGHKQDKEHTLGNELEIAAQAKSQKADVPVKILSKPRANIPSQETGTFCAQGTVTLRVEFLDSGEIGKIIPINGLPQGATEEAIKAARRLSFEPARKDGKPVTVFKQIQYNFSLY